MNKENDGIIKVKDKFSIKKDDESNLNTLVFPKGVFNKIEDAVFLNTAKIKGENFQEVCVPNTVEIVGNKSFKGCQNLERVTFTDNTKVIGEACFRDCRKLKTIKLPNGIKSLSEYLFYACTNLKRINIPDSVTNISDNCFSLCSGLTEINIPESVTYIGNSVFSSCKGLQKFIYNDNISNIGKDTFFNCTNLEEINLPSNLKTIDRNAFSGCSSLTNIKLPNKLNIIGDNSFEECSSLVSITIPNSVNDIGYEAFANCDNLEAVTILPNTMRNKKINIQDKAFSNCLKLKMLNLPKGSLDNVDAFDFENMENLKHISYSGRDILNLNENEKFNNLIYNGRLIYIEYLDENNESICKIIEDSDSKKRDMRSVEITNQYKKLIEHDVFKKHFKFDSERTKICINMLSTLRYDTCNKLLNQLEEKENDFDRKSQNSIKKKEAENKFLAPFNKIKEFILKLFFTKTKQGHQDYESDTTPNITTVEFLETLFDSPNTSESINDFNSFVSNNMTDIINIKDSEELENLAKIQRNFNVLMRQGLLRKRCYSGRLTLKDLFKYKNLYQITSNYGESKETDTKSMNSMDSNIRENIDVRDWNDLEL